MTKEELFSKEIYPLRARMSDEIKPYGIKVTTEVYYQQPLGAEERNVATYTTLAAPTGDMLKLAMVANKYSEKGYVFKDDGPVEASLDEIEFEIEHFIKRHCGESVTLDILDGVDLLNTRLYWESF